MVSRFNIILLATFVFFLISISLFLRVIPPCSLAFIEMFNKSCVSSISDKEILSTSSIRNLEQELKKLREALISKDCAYSVFADNSSDQNLVSQQLTEKEINSFKLRELSELSGCWEFVGTKQTFVSVDCEESAEEDCNKAYSQNATYCFADNGTGTVKTEFNNLFCKANTSVRFSNLEQENTELLFTELTDQDCEAGVGFGSLVAREYICNLNSQKLIECRTSNQLNNTGKITLRRIE